MKKSSRWVGLDVHGETVAVAVAEKDGSVRFVGTIANRPEPIRRMMRKLEEGCKLHVCYEAGPCGFVLYWQLTSMGIDCQVIAPSLIPVKAGDRVKTDRRDAEKLARCHRSGDLTAVWVPDAEQLALRDLVRVRHAAKQDLLRARNRLSKFLLRQGLYRPEGSTSWGAKHTRWLEALAFEHPAHQDVFVDLWNEVKRGKERVERIEKAIDAAVERAPARMQTLFEGLQTLRGVAKITAITLVTEVGTFERFESASQLMAYVGVVPREHSSGDKTRRAGITKTGNARLRHVLGEAAWFYRLKPSVQGALKKRHEGQSEDVKAIAWKAQHRLHSRYQKLSLRSSSKGKVITAVSRELVGFAWALGRHIEQQMRAAA